ncbi:MAG: hypothetical protein K1W23_15300 [Lachnospiraceae bacterium]|jgi:hypothetical protein
MAEQKVNAAIFGKGKYWEHVKPYLSDNLKVMVFMDNFVKASGIVSPAQWRDLSFDKIVICAASYKTKLEMMNQLLELGCEKEQIGFIEEYQSNYEIKVYTGLNHSKKYMIKRYSTFL